MKIKTEEEAVPTAQNIVSGWKVEDITPLVGWESSAGIVVWDSIIRLMSVLGTGHNGSI